METYAIPALGLSLVTLRMSDNVAMVDMETDLGAPLTTCQAAGSGPCNPNLEWLLII